MANHQKGGRSYTAADAVLSNFDLLYEILIRLPPNSLLNFRIVCSQWYDLISSRQFCIQHTRRYGIPRTTGMFYGDHDHWKYAKFDKNYQLMSHDLCKFPDTLEILDSCNGLLLCSIPLGKRKSFEFKLYVCNPTTKQVTRIHTPMWRKGFCYIRSEVLAVDPSMPENYRIVFFWFAGKHDGSWCYDVDMYESETSAWRHCTAFSASKCIYRNGVYWNGAVYWFKLCEGILFSFDLKQESFKETRLLPMIDKRRIIVHLGPCQGHLYLFSLDDHFLRVYEMNQDHSHLSMKVSISRYNIRGNYYFTSAHEFRILMGEDDKLFVLLPWDKVVFIYDIKNPYAAPVETSLPRELCDDDCVCYYYSESLSPV